MIRFFVYTTREVHGVGIPFLLDERIRTDSVVMRQTISRSEQKLEVNLLGCGIMRRMDEV